MLHSGYLHDLLVYNYDCQFQVDTRSEGPSLDSEVSSCLRYLSASAAYSPPQALESPSPSNAVPRPWLPTQPQNVSHSSECLFVVITRKLYRFQQPPPSRTNSFPDAVSRIRKKGRLVQEAHRLVGGVSASEGVLGGALPAIRPALWLRSALVVLRVILEAWTA